MLTASPRRRSFKEKDPMASMFLLNSLMMGGSVKKTARIVNALKSRGHELHVGYLSTPDTLRRDIDPKIPLRFFKRKRKFEFRIVLELRNYILAHGITNLLCINLYPSLYGILCSKLLKNAPLNIYVSINITDFQNRKERLQMFLYRPLLRMASGIVFGCRRQQEAWLSRHDLPRAKSVVIYNGVDCSFFSPDALEEDSVALRENFGFSRQDVVIVNVAEFRPEKRQEDLVRACYTLHHRGYPIRLVLVGDGPELERTEQLVGNLGIGNIVYFRGRISDVRPDLSAADLFVLPSTAVETFSNAALEAMAMGKPVLLSDIGGAAEMVRDGESGFLFSPANGTGLVEKLETLVKEPETRHEMGARARAMVQAQFCFEAMLEQYEQLLLVPSFGTEEIKEPSRGGRP
jgi:glycosyltransferase involved in cell wall biosynthesis